MQTKLPQFNSGGFRVFQSGQKYMNTWPNERRLAIMFPENRVIKATRFGIHFMPPIAIFTLAWQIALDGQLGSAVATALLACSLPMQGLWWLGRRSVKPLPPGLRAWFSQVRDKLAAAGHKLTPVEGTPNYQSLAEVLQHAFRHYPDTAFDDL